MEISSVGTENANDFFDDFEPLISSRTITWGLREVQVFPYDKRFSSTGYWPYNSTFSNGEQRCKSCSSDLVDFFDGYAYSKDNLLIKTGLIFHRTCANCFNSDKGGKIFGSRQKYGGKGPDENGHYFEYCPWTFETYIIPLNSSQFFIANNLDTSEEIKHKTFFQRLQTFLDNFDAYQADANEAIIAGFFRAFGIVRESVDFFVAVGDYLKEKCGLDKKKEKGIYKGKLELSEETKESVEEVARASPLDIFRRIFPTGREVQKACLDAMGIKYEPDAPFKRVLEEFSAAWPFGPLWMAICAAGQVAVESGFIGEKAKPFYEIGLALFLVFKMRKPNGNPLTALEVKEISKVLVESEIDIAKIRAGDLAEINRANKEITNFLDSRALCPTTKAPLHLESSRIPVSTASNNCGWKVGDPINNRTLLGDVPTWSTVRYRYWKNKALEQNPVKVSGKLKYEPVPENIARMEKGLAPQTYNKELKKWESIELHHQPPQRDGGLFDFIEVTPQDHASIDKYRYDKIFSKEAVTEK